MSLTTGSPPWRNRDTQYCPLAQCSTIFLPRIFYSRAPHRACTPLPLPQYGIGSKIFVRKVVLPFRAVCHSLRASYRLYKLAVFDDHFLVVNRNVEV